MSLQHMKILAVLELAVLLAEQPGEHLSGLHTGTHDASRLVPVLGVAGTAAASARLALADLQPDLTQDADEEVVDVVVYPHRDLGELGPVRARQAFAIWGQKKENGGVWLEGRFFTLRCFHDI